MHITQIGSGVVSETENGLYLHLPTATKQVYSNAQITSYQIRKQMAYSPPLRLELTAWATGELKGTAGFGLWNHPVMPRGSVRLPQALWFFHASAPNHMELAKGIPGSGWKAATFNAARWQFLALLPAAPIGFLLMRVPALYNLLWGIGQRAIGVSEALLNPEMIYTPHIYTIDWQTDQVIFSIDGAIVHQTDRSPQGKLGFVAWIDNQYAIVTPQGRFGWGLLQTALPQSLFIENLKIVSQ